MTYQVLANKYRPTMFKHLIGQKSIVDTITYALTQQQLHHAYIFSGTRGIGKTSTARIFAMALNCQQHDTEPCGKCPSCQQIQMGNDIDVTEIDAASNSKVDEIRDIIAQIHYPPTQGRYKIYLIDEVHMLSTHSFNALLKTIESPPDFVKFLFATTDPQKIPKTIHSRCIEFKLQAFSQTAIQDRLSQILTIEAIEYDGPAIEKIATAGHGSMRDALTLLDQAIALGQGRVSSECVQSLLGLVSETMLDEITTAIESQDYPTLMSICKQIESEHLAVESIIYQLMRHIYDKIRACLLNNELTVLEQLQLYYQICEQAQASLVHQPSPYIALEVLLVRLSYFKVEPESLEDMIRRQSQASSHNSSKPVDNQSKLPEVNNPQKPAPVQLTGIAKQVLQNAHCHQTNDQVVLSIPSSMSALLNDRITKQIKDAYHQKKPDLVVVFKITEDKERASSQATTHQSKQPIKVSPDIKRAVDHLAGQIEQVTSQTSD
ncbi:MAG: DNA polymerase III, subunit gamma and tau [Legionellales bacterium]|nr:DNA polymerase III, subunit gamma and tau [Legionellales bacterium]